MNKAPQKASTASIVTFFAVTFALTWSCFFAAGSLSRNAPPHGFARLLLFIGIFAPAIVALSLTAATSGWPGVTDLLRQLIRWRVSVRFYLFAIGYMAAVKLAVALIHRVVLGAWPAFGDTPWYLMIAATIVSVLLGGQTGEEIGWRGYALPRLASRIGLGAASIVLGVLWAAWHLPLFFILGGDTVGQSFPMFLLQVTALSVAIAWLFAKTNGSLLLAMLLHSAVNNTKDIVPSATAGAHNAFAWSGSAVGWITVGVLWICAIGFLLAMRRTTSSPGPVPPAVFDAAIASRNAS